MNYLNLFTGHNLALLSDWLTETGELYVDVELPHSAAAGTPYLLRSLQQLKELVAKQTWPELCLTVFHYLQFPVRGRADAELLARALAHIPDGEDFDIISLDHYYPNPCEPRGGGRTHAELRQQLEEVKGEHVGVGVHPLAVHDLQWYRVRPDTAFVLLVSKSHNYYENYGKHPERYTAIEKVFWLKPE